MSFWQNKKVLITGADGFIGSNLAKKLIEERALVYSFLRSPISSNSLLTREFLTNKLAGQVIGSVEDPKIISEAISQNQIEIIFHLAAQTLVETGQVNPISTFEVNIRGTWNVLEASRQNKITKLVVASTTHVYGDNPNLPYKEDYYPQPSRPYETSKACADLLAQSYADSFGLPVEIPRMVNLYGPGDFNFSRIVPKVIRSILGDQNPQLWDVGAERDFLYIDDAIRALMILVEKNLPDTKRHRVFNFGSGESVEIADLARKIIEVSGKNLTLDLQPVPPERSKEIPRQFVSIEKAVHLLNWTPQVSLEEGLRKTYQWYEKHLKH